MRPGISRPSPTHPDQARRESQTHRLIAGNLSLDFANTLNGHRLQRAHEYLHDPRDLVLWAVHAGLLSAAEGRTLLRRAAAEPKLALRVFTDAIRLREAIFDIFHSLALGASPPRSALEVLNRQWKEGQKHAAVKLSGSGYALVWDDQPTLRAIPRRISQAAIRLLTSEDPAPVRACLGQTCDWLFIDNSRNHLRRWCSMDECGNRAKMRRRRLKGSASNTPH